MSDRSIVELPDSIGQLSRLQSLNLSGNKLTALPDSIGQLSQLQRLDLSENQLTAVPDSIGQLAHLQSLDLSRNQLSALPDSIGQLSRLWHFSVALNRLRILPSSIGTLTQLRSLCIGGNHIRRLPSSMITLTTLTALSLGGNPLIELPEWIDRLQSLAFLDALNDGTVISLWTPSSQTVYWGQKRHDGLKSLPDSLRTLSSLENCYLHGNDSLRLPAEVLGPTLRDVFGPQGRATRPALPSKILEYYFRVRGGRRPLNEAKLILVGRGAVGKTSLVNRLVHGRFHRNEKKTDGIQITEWPLRLNGKEDVRLNIWDFGGQEIMHATHQFFLTQRSLYLLVLSGREGREDADAEYWLKLIESFGGDSPVVVVLNKIKQDPFDINCRALQQKYPVIRDFIRTDCRAGIGIKELGKAIERETDRLEHLRDAFPASWFSIKEQLAGMQKRIRKNYLTFDEYRTFCAGLGEQDEEAQENLAGYLHNLGMVLNYREDPRLQDTHVLNPHWVTNGIYKVINSDKLGEQKGEIRLRDIGHILDPREYPADMRRFILDLMRKFDLCFSFPDDDVHYLIPELLDKQEPAETAEFNERECLNFQYHYTVLPEGLLPRFIVRTHMLSEGLPRWRTGVMLAFETGRALVKSDLEEKKVFISVSGPGAGRRRLLAVIRSYFEEIHRQISRLEPQEMVPLPDHPRVVMPYKDLLVMEEKGLFKVPVVIERDVVELDVHELLDGVDAKGMRPRERTMHQKEQAAVLFYSYAHKDEKLRNELETHLQLLRRQALIEGWHDRKIEAGDEWRRKIDENLQRADIILLLVSADFIASDYCHEIEMRRALERHSKGEARVIPVILRDVDWSGAEFGNLQALPRDGRPVTKWRPKDSGWRNVAEGIRKAVEQMRKKPGRPA